MKLISVVIPCYNHGAYLEEAVESVLAQSYQHFEIVIVNDGSTDPYTNEVLLSFDKLKCRVLHTDNQGLPAARNNGIRATEGDYICCLDADDKYHPDYFRKAISVLDDDEKQKYGAVAAWVQFFGSSDALWKTIGSNSEGFAPFLQGIRNNLQSATMFRRICWEKIGGFDESMTLGYEDWDFWLKMLELGYEWFCLEEPLIYYRQKDYSMVTRSDEVRPQILESLIRKHHRFYKNHLVPILLERDQEVCRLTRENKKLAEQLAVGNDTCLSGFQKSRFAIFCKQVRQALKKIYPFP
ncbi:MAG: glycosyltransferase family 2 protein [Proteobacteria bacterium]|nr:glycosyltransferase family 2 protein [Pseudomonadota bacterium]MBU1060714.1 glycosyltransferase family 2 protein [Pseudomonadota bacterium]